MKSILIIPSRYPTIYKPHNYKFVEDQANIIATNYNVQIISTINISLKDIFKYGIKHLGIKKKRNNNFVEVLLLIPSIPKLKRINNFFRYLGNRYLIKKYIKLSDIDIVHLHTYLSGDIAVYLKNKYNIPYFITEHYSLLLKNNLDSFDFRLAKKIFENAKQVFAVSKTYGSVLEKRFEIKTKILHNFVDTDFFKPSLLPIKNNKYIFLTIGNLVKVKNHQLLIRAFTKAFAGDTNVELHIIGEGEEYYNLQNLIKQLNMQNSIKLLGYQSRDKIKEYLDRCNAFVMTSMHETFCIAVIEAMSMAKPIICTDFGGVVEEIKHLKDCIITNHSEIELSIAMKQYYDNNYIKSEENRKFVIENFSVQSFLKDIKSVYST